MTEHEHEHDEPAEIEPDDDDAADDGADDEPDEAPGDESGPQPDSPPAENYSPLLDPERQRKVGQSFDTYAKALGRNYEEDSTKLIRCPLCPDNFPGFILPADAGLMPAEVKDAVNMFLGYAREQEYSQDPHTRTCPTCRGEGKTATGSYVAAHKTRTCDDCRGYGYTPPPNPGNVGANGDVPVTLTFNNGDEARVIAEVDAWGEPRVLPDGRENPNYGKMPQFKIQVEPWGTTANLTAQDASVGA